MSSQNKELGQILKRITIDQLGKSEPPTWEKLAATFYHSDDKEFAGCEHAMMATILRMELDRAQHKNELLEERMEDLCKEMEEIKNKDKPFILGPGVDSKWTQNS